MEQRRDLFSRSIGSLSELDDAAEHLNDVLISAYEESCAVRKRQTNRNVPWWNKQLESHRTEVRRLFNKAKRDKIWEPYKEALTRYNIELRSAKRRTWRTMCEGIKEMPETSRIQKALSKDHSNGLGQIKRMDGTNTNNLRETNSVLMQVHFPGSVEVGSDFSHTTTEHRWSHRAYRLSGKLFTKERIEWALNGFQPYKSPGPDQLFPALLQKCLDIIASFLIKIFRASYSYGCIPSLWRKVRVAFIPKGGKKPAEDPKAYRPISLSSFLLKTMEKIINIHVRGQLSEPLHAKQFAYQSGKSTEDALHDLVGKIEKTIEFKEVALCAFLDIEGAFDNTSYASIIRACKRKGVDEFTVK